MKTRNNKHIPYAVIGLIATVIISFLAFVGYQAAQSNTSKSDKIQIVASTNVWGDIASQVGGNNVEVTSILNDPEADPHLFESDAKTASKLADAQLVIVNGLGYDEFMDKLLAAAPSDKAIITVSDVLGANKDANPHLWYDLPRINEVALAIQDKLIAIDSQHKAEYARNTKAFIVSMQPLLAQVSPRVGDVAYTERVAGYLIDDLHLRNRTPNGFSESVESGSEPTPQQLAEFEAVLKAGQVDVLLYNNQAVNDVTEQLRRAAQTAGVAVVGVSETIPQGKNFQSWQLDQLNAILKAL